MFDVQAAWVVSVLSGEVSLPTAMDMESWLNQHTDRLAEGGYPPHYFHMLGSAQWQYYETICSYFAAACKESIDVKPDAVIQMIYEDVAHARKSYPTSYRKREYSVTSPSTFTVAC